MNEILRFVCVWGGGHCDITHWLWILHFEGLTLSEVTFMWMKG